METAYNYQWGPSDAVCKDWEFTKEGQAMFLHDLVKALNALDVKALYYWFPEECGNGKNAVVQNGWLNRGLSDDCWQCRRLFMEQQSIQGNRNLLR